MKKSHYFILLMGLLYNLPIFAQENQRTLLEEVFLTDTKLKNFSTGQSLVKLSDSLLQQVQPLLTDALNFNTPIYFKENGLGMVSSPSFRGTTASQTAVLWNGININSRFNGQTDFNTINVAGYDNISVRGGGGSVVYGTGAIGGTVHLNTQLIFEEAFENNLFLQYGSFNTLDARYKLKASSKKWSLSIAGGRNSSDNDYDYPSGQGYNENGEFYNTALNIAAGYRLNSSNTLKLYSSFFDGQRHFSLVRPSETKTKYKDTNTRNLIEWVGEYGKFVSVSEIAFLQENYKYFSNINSNSFSYGEANTYIGKYDLKYKISNKFLINTVLTNTYTKGQGSNIEENKRNIFSAAVLVKQALGEKFQYEAGLRKEATNNYKSPFLYSLGASYQFSSFYDLKLKASKNFRIPTYNDLYWAGSGNPEIKPETSKQIELGNSFSYKNFELNLTGYFNDIENLIHWLPGSDGIFEPRNEDHVQTYGLEALLNWSKPLAGNQNLSISSSYAYTRSVNKDSGKQLIYVPYHKITARINYAWQSFQFSLQSLYNGEIYTRSDNSEGLEDYVLANFSASYAPGKTKNYQLGVRLRNLFNEEYQNVEDRYMPGTSLNFYINLKF